MGKRDGLRRFLALVPDVPVDEAMEQAEMTDEEIEELICIAGALLDSQKQDSLYDWTVLEGQRKLAGEFRKLQSGFVHLCNAMDTLVDAVYRINGRDEKATEFTDADLSTALKDVMGDFADRATHPTNVVPLRPER